MNDERDERASRTELRRRERAIMQDRQAVLEQFIKLPDHRVTGLKVSSDVDDALALMRRLKPSGARARVMKNLLRRASDEDWAELTTVTLGSAEQKATQAAHDDFVIGLRDRMVAGDDAAFQTLRSEHPDADHQRVRQLALQSRRNPESSPAKGARKKLTKVLRILYPMP